MKHIKTFKKIIHWENVKYVKCVWEDNTLTKDNIYVIVDSYTTVSSNKIKIKNDKGNMENYLRIRFIPATPEEIEQYKLEQKIAKYNL